MIVHIIYLHIQIKYIIEIISLVISHYNDYTLMFFYKNINTQTF